jgi:hypothetical protein
MSTPTRVMAVTLGAARATVKPRRAGYAWSA